MRIAFYRVRRGALRNAPGRKQGETLAKAVRNRRRIAVATGENRTGCRHIGLQNDAATGKELPIPFPSEAAIALLLDWYSRFLRKRR